MINKIIYSLLIVVFSIISPIMIATAFVATFGLLGAIPGLAIAVMTGIGVLSVVERFTPKPVFDHVGVTLFCDGSSGDRALEQSMALLMQEKFSLFKRKQHDYGPHNISKLGTKGILVRVNDKFERLLTLLWENEKPKVEEKLEDTWSDMGVYSFMAILVERGLWPSYNKKSLECEHGVFIEGEIYTVHSLSNFMCRNCKTCLPKGSYLAQYIRDEFLPDGKVHLFRYLDNPPVCPNCGDERHNQYYMHTCGWEIEQKCTEEHS